MSFNVRILDCTLRDGGYVNAWEFSNDVATDIIAKLNLAKVDIIEVGFLDDSVTNDFEGTKFTSIESIKRLIDFKKKYTSKIVAMMMVDKFALSGIISQQESCIDGIRVCFKKNQLHKAVQIAKEVKKQGYELYMQPAAITDYSDNDVIIMLNEMNGIDPKAVYIVDTYGLMHKSSAIHYFNIFCEHLNDYIEIGFHSHNNLQLSFSNSQEIIDSNQSRTLIIDSSIFGMGRGAGNLCTELVTKYINDNLGKKYDLLPILEIVDKHINPLFEVYSWGYSVPYYLAATNKCHPNYATYLGNKNTISIKAINSILKRIPEEKQRNYDEKLIQELYINYQSNEVSDEKALCFLKDYVGDRKVLLLAPGKSVAVQSERIRGFIASEDPICVAINYIPEEINADILFVGNSKRYESLVKSKKNIDGTKIIVTSNIIRNMDKYDYIVNYNDLIDPEYSELDISGAMAIRLLVRIGVKKVYLAGYDGFSIDSRKNYFDEKYYYSIDSEENERRNSSLEEQLLHLSNQIEMRFLTTTRFKL